MNTIAAKSQACVVYEFTYGLTKTDGVSPPIRC